MQSHPCLVPVAPSLPHPCQPRQHPALLSLTCPCHLPLPWLTPILPGSVASLSHCSSLQQPPDPVCSQLTLPQFNWCPNRPCTSPTGTSTSPTAGVPSLPHPTLPPAPSQGYLPTLASLRLRCQRHRRGRDCSRGCSGRSPMAQVRNPPPALTAPTQLAQAWCPSFPQPRLALIPLTRYQLGLNPPVLLQNPRVPHTPIFHLQQGAKALPSPARCPQQTKSCPRLEQSPCALHWATPGTVLVARGSC